MNSILRVSLMSLMLFAFATPYATAQPAAKPADVPAAKTDARGAVHPTADDIDPLKVGESLPKLAPLKNAKGESVDLADATKGKTTVLILYRGGWCPYCNTHLADLAHIQPTLAENNVDLIAISPDSPETLTKYGEKHPLPYTLLSDSDHSVIKAFGVAFAVDADTQKKYKGYGIDLAAASGSPDAVLPVPSVFVINPEGKVTFSHSNADYKKRLSGDDVLAAAGVKPAKKDADKKTGADK